MTELQPPFTISSHPPYVEVNRSGDENHSSRPCLALSTQPVVRLSRSLSRKNHKSINESDQVIITIAGQGWSINNVSHQTVLSSQKVSPGLIFGAPCVSISIPELDSPVESGQTSKPIKCRRRYIYAPVASSSSDTSPAVNEGRTVWLWVEKEVRGGFGERNSRPGVSDPEGSLSQLVKEFPSKVDMVHPFAVTEALSDSSSPSAQAGRIIVLLQTGEVRLCDSHLVTISTVQTHPLCSISGYQPPPLVRLNVNDHVDSSGVSCRPSDLASGSCLSSSTSHHKLLYIIRLIPNVNQVADSNDNKKQPSSKSKKRKSTLLNSFPLTASPTYYSSFEIDIFEVNSKHFYQQGSISSTQDFYDLAIGSEGWMTILGRDQVLSTYQLEISTAQKITNPKLALVPHPKCQSIKISPCFPASADSSSAQPPPPVLLPLHRSHPIVLFLIFHPSSSERCLLGLVFDLFHRSVLHTLDLTSSVRSKDMSLPSTSPSRSLTCFTATLSAPSCPFHAYLSLVCNDRRLVQALQLPALATSGPTWVDALQKKVTKATETWVSRMINGKVKKSFSEYQKVGLCYDDLLITTSDSTLNLPISNIAPAFSDALQAFLKRFNSQRCKTIELGGKWDSETALKSEEAWLDCIVPQLEFSLKAKNKNPSSNNLKNTTQNLHQNLSPGSEIDGEKSLTEDLDDEKSSEKKIFNHLPREFVRALLYLCLGQFIGNYEERKSVMSGETLQAGHVTSYPSKIVYWLLMIGVVEEGMTPGGVLAALCQAYDWENLELAITKLVDAEEHQLVKTLGYLLRCEYFGSCRSQFDSDSLNTASDSVNLQKHIQFRRIISKIVSQPISQLSMKNSIKQVLNISEATILLKISYNWVKIWEEVDLGVLSTNKVPDYDMGAKVPDILSGVVPLPGVSDIFKFVQCVLDAHLLELIQYKPAHLVLKLLKSSLDGQLEIGTNLQRLKAPVGHFARVKPKKQNKKLYNAEVGKDQGKALQSEANKRPASKIGSDFQQKSKLGDNKCSKSLQRKKALKEASMAVGQYALEEFPL
ncbi:hypothetical protein BY996DRAFT_4572693 [Phakopsora pachyrhizi]|uniref:Expressed protein n=1 Tax=Phakopsora pachyrhizi TaxID=170000 RepID=A0AAV0ANA0_PHAPC|nr:hypothetical protein BY996DRAFT_4572693 [Phakopsora pachyrhizi]CAH7669016.1 expressed protein [Phakopsora pachyrhizi]